MGCTGLYKGQMWFFCSTVRWINSLSFLLFLNLYITVTTEELRLHSFCRNVASPKPWTHLACAAWPHAYYSDLIARSDQSGKMLRDICMVWDISDIRSEDGNSWAVCHLQTYSLFPLFFSLYYYLSLGITISELCCHSYQKACCRKKDRMQKKFKLGLASQLVLQAKVTWQRVCITVSCALVKHRIAQDSWLYTWLRKGKMALMALWLPGFRPPELMLPLMWLKE